MNCCQHNKVIVFPKGNQRAVRFFTNAKAGTLARLVIQVSNSDAEVLRLETAVETAENVKNYAAFIIPASISAEPQGDVCDYSFTIISGTQVITAQINKWYWQENPDTPNNAEPPVEGDMLNDSIDVYTADLPLMNIEGGSGGSGVDLTAYRTAEEQDEIDSTLQENIKKNAAAIAQILPLINYSTDEQDTGIKWVDGRPVYQKTLIFLQKTWTDNTQNVVGTIANTIPGAAQILESWFLRTNSPSSTNGVDHRAHCQISNDKSNLLLTFSSGLTSIGDDYLTVRYIKQ